MSVQFIAKTTQMDTETMRIWRCANGLCGQVLGVITPEAVTMTHAGAEFVALGPIRRRCHKCGTPNEVAPLTVAS